MAEISGNVSARLPDHVSVETVLARLPVGASETALAAALTEAFPGFGFSAASIDDQYWRDADRADRGLDPLIGMEVVYAVAKATPPDFPRRGALGHREAL